MSKMSKAQIESAKFMATLPNNEVVIWFRDFGAITLGFIDGSLYSDKGILLEASKWDSVKKKVNLALASL